MKKSILGLGAALVVALGASAASASEYLFQWDDGTEGQLYGDTYRDGILIQHAPVGAESYGGSYGLWNGSTIISDFDVGFNIYDLHGALSDTWRLYGSTGSTFFGTPFSSDTEGSPLNPLTGASSIVETGDYQTVYDFTVSNGDHYTMQFRSDVDAVPEPASWALMIGGFGMVGGMMRRRNAARLQTN